MPHTHPIVLPPSLRGWRHRWPALRRGAAQLGPWRHAAAAVALIVLLLSGLLNLRASFAEAWRQLIEEGTSRSLDGSADEAVATSMQAFLTPPPLLLHILVLGVGLMLGALLLAIELRALLRVMAERAADEGPPRRWALLPWRMAFIALATILPVLTLALCPPEQGPDSAADAVGLFLLQAPLFAALLRELPPRRVPWPECLMAATPSAMLLALSWLAVN